MVFEKDTARQLCEKGMRGFIDSKREIEREEETDRERERERVCM